MSILLLRIVFCNEKLEIVKLVVSQKEIYVYSLLRNYQLYDFEFFIAKNNTEQPDRNRKVENLPFFVGSMSGARKLYGT